MGARNRSGVRVERRGGRRVLIIDFRYRSKDGRLKRFRRDALLQSMTAARSEADRLRRYALEHGTVEPPGGADLRVLRPRAVRSTRNARLHRGDEGTL